MSLGRLCAALFWLAALAAAPTAHAGAPMFWDATERLPKPDLAALARLRFLTTTDFPPFNYLDGNGRLSGFHVDLARAICAELAITINEPDASITAARKFVGPRQDAAVRGRP